MPEVRVHQRVGQEEEEVFELALERRDLRQQLLAGGGAPQEAHDQGVEVAPRLVTVLAQPALVAESQLLVAGDPTRVVLVHPKVDAIEVQLLEAPPAQCAQSIRAVALALEVAPADDDAHVGRAVPPVDRMEAGGADVEPFRGLLAGRSDAGVDRERLAGRVQA